jgi:hypothetical protein
VRSELLLDANAIPVLGQRKMGLDAIGYAVDLRA